MLKKKYILMMLVILCIGFVAADETVIKISIGPPSLEITNVYPTSDTDVKQNTFFNYTVNVTCYSNVCGEVNVSFNSPLISTVEADTPFYTNSTNNPVNISMVAGESQLVTIWINATGNVGTNHTFIAFANITSNMSINNITQTFNISITAPFASNNINSISSIIFDSVSGLFGDVIRVPNISAFMSSSVNKILSVLTTILQEVNLDGIVSRLSLLSIKSVESFTILASLFKITLFQRQINDPLQVDSATDRLAQFVIQIQEPMNIDVLTGRMAQLTVEVTGSLKIDVFTGRMMFLLREVSATLNIESSVDRLANLVRKIVEFFTISAPITTNVISDVSLEHLEIDLGDVAFNSATYITIFNSTVNLSQARHITFKGSGGVKIIAGGGSNDLSMKLDFNGVTLFDEVVRSVSGPQDLGAFGIPFSMPTTDSPAVAGINNITIQVKESGAGSLNLTNLLILGDTDRSNAGFEVNHSNGTFNGVYSSATFINIANFTLEKSQNSTSVIDVAHKFGKEGATGTTPSCYLKNTETSEHTPTYTRYLSGSADTGSSGMNFRSSLFTDGDEKWEMWCLSDDTDTIINNVTFYGFSTKDSNGNRIEGFQNQTEINGVTGTTKILSYENYVVQNNSEVQLLATVNLQSTSGAQIGTLSPIIKVNSSTVSEAACSNSYARSLSTNLDVGAVKIYVSCQGLSAGETHDFNVFAIVAGGETVNILNASLSAYEAESLDIVSGIVPPLVVITSPINGSSVGGIIDINASVPDLSDQGWKSNVSLLNSDLSFNATIYLNTTANTNITNATWDTTSFIDGNYAIIWVVTEDAGSNSDTIYITIDNPNFYIGDVTEEFSILSLINRIFSGDRSVDNLIEINSLLDALSLLGRIILSPFYILSSVVGDYTDIGVILSISISDLFEIDSLAVRIPHPFRIIIQSIEMESIVDRLVFGVRFVSSTINLDSSVERIGLFSEKIVETFNISSSVERIPLLFRILSQSININSIVDRLFEGGVSIDEPFNLDSSVERIGLFSEKIVETFNISSSVERIPLLFRILSQSININSIVDRLFNGRVSIDEPFNLDSSVERIGLFTRVVSAPFNIITSVVGSYIDIGTVLSRSISDIFNADSSVARLYEGRPDISDAINIDSSITSRAGFTRIQALIFYISDSVTETVVEVSDEFIREVGQAFDIETLVNRMASPIRIISQSININSIVDRTTLLYRQIISPFEITSSIERFISLPRTISEEFVIESSVVRIKTIVRSIVESINIESSVERVLELFRVIVQQIKVILGVTAPPPPSEIAPYSTVDVILPNTKTVPYVQLGQTLTFPDQYTYPYIILNG